MRLREVWWLREFFLPWPLPERQAMVMLPPIRVTHSLIHHLTEQTRTGMSATGVE